MQTGIKLRLFKTYDSYPQRCQHPIPQHCGFHRKGPLGMRTCEKSPPQKQQRRALRRPRSGYFHAPAEGIVFLPVLDLKDLVVESFGNRTGFPSVDHEDFSAVEELTDRRDDRRRPGGEGFLQATFPVGLEDLVHGKTPF